MLEAVPPTFRTFLSEASTYLMKLHDRSARLFGIRYMEYLQAKHRHVYPNPRPQPNSPSDRLVRMELTRLFQEHYQRRSEAQ